MVKLTAWCLTFCVLVSEPVWGDECSDILSQGIKDQKAFTSVDEYETHLKQLLKMSKEQLEKESKRGGGHGKLALGILKLGGGGQSTQDRVKELKENLSLDFEDSIHTKNGRQLVTSVVNSSVVQAWSACIEKQPIIAYYAAPEPDDIVVSITYRRPTFEQAPNAVQITNVTASPSLIVNGDATLKPGAQINTGNSITQRYRRTQVDKSVNVAIDVKGFERTIVFIPGQESEKALAELTEESADMAARAQELRQGFIDLKTSLLITRFKEHTAAHPSDWDGYGHENNMRSYLEQFMVAWTNAQRRIDKSPVPKRVVVEANSGEIKQLIKENREQRSRLNTLERSWEAISKARMVTTFNEKVDPWKGFGHRHQMQDAIRQFLRCWHSQVSPLKSIGIAIPDKGNPPWLHEKSFYHDDACE